MDQDFSEFAGLIMQQSMLSEIVLRLQNRHKLNRHFLIYCIWYAQSAKGRLHKNEFEAMLQEAAMWHECVVSRLKQLEETVMQAAQWRCLQSPIKEVTDFASVVEIQLLNNLAISKTLNPRRNERQTLNDVCYNLISFYKYFQCQFSPQDHAEVSFLINLLFPNSETQRIEQLLIELTQKLKIDQQPGEQIDLLK